MRKNSTKNDKSCAYTLHLSTPRRDAILRPDYQYKENIKINQEKYQTFKS